METKREMRKRAINRLNEMYKAGPYTTQDIVVALAGSSGWVGRILDLLTDDDGLTDDDYLALLRDAVDDYREEHESAKLWHRIACANDEYINRGTMPIPRDANDMPIHIGDRVVEHEDGHDFIVDGYEYDGEWWVFHRDGIRASAHDCTHYNVMDVLSELVEKVYENAWNDGKAGVHYDIYAYEKLMKEYAEKLRLKED